MLEAYRGQLRLVRSRLDPIWRAHAARLNTSGVRPAQRFAELMVDQAAEERNVGSGANLDEGVGDGCGAIRPRA